MKTSSLVASEIRRSIWYEVPTEDKNSAAMALKKIALINIEIMQKSSWSKEEISTMEQV
jgi:hypothetical protein